MGKKGDEYHDLGQKEVTLNNTQTSQNLALGLNFNLVGKEFNHDYSVRQIQIQAIESQIENNLKLNLKLVDKLTDVDSWMVGNNCAWTDWYVKHDKSKLSGSIALEYLVPEGQWISTVNIQNGVGLLSKNNMQIIGALENTTTNLEDGSLMFWAQPGSKIQLKFIIPEYSGVNQKLGQIDIIFKMTPQKIKNGKYDNSIKDIQVDQLISQLTKDISETNMVFNSERESNIFFILNSLLQNKEKLKKYVWSLNSDQIAKLSDIIFNGLAKKDLPNVQNALHIKSLAALVSYEVSMAYLDQIQPLCEKAVRVLPLTGSPEEMTGLKLSQIYLERLWLRLSSFDYQVLFALLKSLESYENQNMSYAQVMQNKVEVLKLQKADDLIAASVDMSEGPFYLAGKDLKKLKAGMGSIGASPEIEERIFKQIEEMKELENKFFVDYMDHLDLYLSTNNQMVSVKPLIQEFDNLIAQKDEFMRNLKNGIRFYSSGSGGQAGFYAQLTRQITHQIEAIRRPVSIKFFEPIRKSYFELNKNEEKIKKFENCIFEN